MKLEQLLEKKEIKQGSGGPAHARAEAVESVCNFMGDDVSESFGYWLGRTKKMEPHQILDLIRKCKRDGYNPQGLFNSIVNK